MGTWATRLEKRGEGEAKDGPRSINQCKTVHAVIRHWRVIRWNECVRDGAYTL
jgi:hypothetical protein